MVHQNLAARPSQSKPKKINPFLITIEPTTPITEETFDECQKPNLVKARIQGTIDFLEREAIKGKKEGIF